MTFFARVLSIVLVAIGWAASAQGETRVALIIANSNYTNTPRLPNAANDARAVAATLQRVNFKVEPIAENLTQAQMLQVLTAFAAKARDADVALIYYAGHGVEIGGVNYLVPKDASFRSPDDVDFGAVPIDLVMKAVQRARRLKVVILDSCRDNPFISKWDLRGSTRSVGARGLAPVEPASETLVAYAAKAGTTAADGPPNGNSPFATALVKFIPQPGLELSLTFRKVRDEVLSVTRGKQEPFTYGSLGGREFYFVPGRPSTAASPHTAADAPLSVEYIRLDSAAYSTLFGAQVENADARKELFGGRTFLVPNEVHQTFKHLLDGYGTNLDREYERYWEIRDKQDKRGVATARPPARILDATGTVWFPDASAVQVLFATKEWPKGYHIVPHSYWECNQIGLLRPPMLWRPVLPSELDPRIYRKRIAEFIGRFGENSKLSIGLVSGTDVSYETEAERRLRLYKRLAGDNWPPSFVQAQVGAYGSAASCGAENWHFRLTNLKIWITVAAIQSAKVLPGRLAARSLRGVVSSQRELRVATQSLERGQSFDRRIQPDLFAGGAVTIVPMRLEFFRIPSGADTDWLESWTEKEHQFEGDGVASSRSIARLRSILKPDQTVEFSVEDRRIRKLAAPLVSAAARREPGRFMFGPTITPEVVTLEGGGQIPLRKFDPSFEAVTLSSHGYVAAECPHLYVKRGASKVFGKVGPVLQRARDRTLARSDFLALGSGVSGLKLFEEEGEATYLDRLVVLARKNGAQRYQRIAYVAQRVLNYGDHVEVSIDRPTEYEDVVAGVTGYYVPYANLAMTSRNGGD